jgi:hypothetical protein
VVRRTEVDYYCHVFYQSPTVLGGVEIGL